MWKFQRFNMSLMNQRNLIIEPRESSMDDLCWTDWWTVADGDFADQLADGEENTQVDGGWTDIKIAGR